MGIAWSFDDRQNLCPCGDCCDFFVWFSFIIHSFEHSLPIDVGPKLFLKYGPSAFICKNFGFVHIDFNCSIFITFLSASFRLINKSFILSSAEERMVKATVEHGDKLSDWKEARIVFFGEGAKWCIFSLSVVEFLLNLLDKL